MKILEEIRDTAMHLHDEANRGRKKADEKLDRSFSFEYRYGDSWATPQSTYYSVRDPSKRVRVSWSIPVGSSKPSLEVDGTNVRMEYLSPGDIAKLAAKVGKMFETLFELKADDDRQKGREQRDQGESFEAHKNDHVKKVRNFLRG